MSDKEQNYDLDDELLSAYLDGELSADERAAVEARLATDPAAQQLLHELRSVSQSVQAMPTESLGRDLSDEILRRAQAAKPGMGKIVPTKSIAEDEPSRSGDTIPKITVFGSKRAWMWASLAVAASLLIMVVQSGDDSKNKLPNVALQKNETPQNQPADEFAKPARRESVLSPAPGSASPPPATVAFDSQAQDKVSAPVAAMPTDALGLRAGGTAPSGTALSGSTAGAHAAATSRSPKQEMTDLSTLHESTVAAPKSNSLSDVKLSAPYQPTGGVSGNAQASGAAGEKQKSESAGSGPELVVVRVLAKSESLQNKSFDRLLADNGVFFEQQSTKDQPVAFGGGKIPKQLDSEAAAPSLAKKISTKGAPVDVVLVEAPESTIASCLSSINKNSNDYLSVAVDEESRSRDRADEKSPPARKLGESLSRYSRGTVPKGQKDWFGYYDYNFAVAQPSEPTPKGERNGEPGLAPGRQKVVNGNTTWNIADGQPGAEVRRARRLSASGEANRKVQDLSQITGAGSGPAEKDASKPHAAEPKLEAAGEAKADDKSNNRKVLFVFTCEDSAAPSAPTASPPK